MITFFERTIWFQRKEFCVWFFDIFELLVPSTKLQLSSFFEWVTSKSVKPFNCSIVLFFPKKTNEQTNKEIISFNEMWINEKSTTDWKKIGSTEKVSNSLHLQPFIRLKIKFWFFVTRRNIWKKKQTTDCESNDLGLNKIVIHEMIWSIAKQFFTCIIALLRLFTQRALVYIIIIFPNMIIVNT